LATQPSSASEAPRQPPDCSQLCAYVRTALCPSRSPSASPFPQRTPVQKLVSKNCSPITRRNSCALLAIHTQRQLIPLPYLAPKCANAVTIETSTNLPPQNRPSFLRIYPLCIPPCTARQELPVRHYGPLTTDH